jgi:hypothetical protein
MNMTIETFKKILIENNTIEIKQPIWEHTTVFHGPNCPEKYNVVTHLDVAKTIIQERNQGGIYAYFQNSQCLYIGKANCLRARVHAHLLEAEVLWGGAKWKDFFSRYTGELDLYTLAVRGSGLEANSLRLIIELILTEHHKPVWLNHKLKRAKSTNSSDFASVRMDE